MGDQTMTCGECCSLFCCPPWPPRIASKMAFLPPEPTYTMSTDDNGASYNLHLSDSAEFQYRWKILNPDMLFFFPMFWVIPIVRFIYSYCPSAGVPKIGSFQCAQLSILSLSSGTGWWRVHMFLTIFARNESFFYDFQQFYPTQYKYFKQESL